MSSFQVGASPLRDCSSELLDMLRAAQPITAADYDLTDATVVHVTSSFGCELVALALTPTTAIVIEVL
jgi:hypothetical protein